MTGLRRSARSSLRGKLVRLLLLVSMLIALPTLLIVVSSDMRRSEETLESTQRYIREGIVRKGQVLGRNHALVLQGLTLDNAFTGMQELVARAVSEDSDLLYGVYVSSQGDTLAYADVETTPGPKLPIEAWRKLGLGREQFHVTELSVRDARSFGQDVLEVAVPVLDEDPKAPALGTIRYGLSTRQVSEANESARAQARAELKRSVTFLAVLVGIATLIGLAISQAQATRIARPVQELATAAAALARGERDIRVKIESGDEIQALGQAFNQMVLDLDVSYKELESLNRSLEQRIQARTAELSQMNREMRVVLDNVDQGLVMLSSSGRMSGQCSASVQTWFGEHQRDVPFADYLMTYSPDFAANFQVAWEQLEEGFMPRELSIDQLPTQLASQGQVWSFRYIPLLSDETLEGVLVVILDITAPLLLEAETQRQRELMHTFKRFVQDRAGLQSFIHDGSLTIERLKSGRVESPAEAARCLHTLKGNAGLMGLSVVAGLCHELEDELAEGQIQHSTMNRLEQRWQELLRHLAELSGAHRDSLDVDRAEHAAALQRLSANPSDPALRDLIRSWALRPVSTDFETLAQLATALAQRLGKGPISVRRNDGGIRLEAERFAPLMTELVHLVRNAVDHGLESPAERKTRGKSAHGYLSLRASIESDALVLEVADDGRGLDHVALRERAHALGLPYTSDDDVVALICRDGVSTRSEVDDVSGRGVGMAAVYAMVRRLGGSLAVRSTPGVGTTWTLLFPSGRRSGSVYSPGAGWEHSPTRDPARGVGLAAVGGE